MTRILVEMRLEVFLMASREKFVMIKLHKILRLNLQSQTYIEQYAS